MLLLVNKHLYNRYFYLLLPLVNNALVNKMFRIYVTISSFYYVLEFNQFNQDNLFKLGIFE